MHCRLSIIMTIFIFALLMSSCKPSETIIQTAIAETQFAQQSLTPENTFTSTFTQTSTIILTSTMTSTPTITPTFTLTFTPTTTFTPTLSPTPIPMSQTSKHVIATAKSFGFTENTSGCGQELNCHFYEHKDPFATIKVYNNGKIVFICNDYYNGWTSYVKPENSSPPYKMMMEYYFQYADSIFGRASGINFKAGKLGLMNDMVLMYGNHEYETDYGYIVEGEYVKPGKIRLTFYPPD